MKGPLFGNIILADEINRTPPKTQSALLEAMQERQVTIGEQSFSLDQPFLVLATQNPLEQEGTYPLPEAQQDRFLMKVIVGYPSKSEEQMILRQNVQGTKTPVLKQVVSVQEVLQARDLVRDVYMDEKIENYILDIVFATRMPDKYKLDKLKPLIAYGGSPSACIS
jgi:MoxR-like ATPase